jgi:hypothetical protein
MTRLAIIACKHAPPRAVSWSSHPRNRVIRYAHGALMQHRP